MNVIKIYEERLDVALVTTVAIVGLILIGLAVAWARRFRVTNPKVWHLMMRGLIGVTSLLMVILAIKWIMVDDVYSALVAMPLAAAGFAYLLLGGAPYKHTS
ncbi:hypothetical protein A3E49_01920 [Candidatus Saccharibacteria bacterium RIFCSPHIGHO2_12_FULL_49_19]|nr:MAG: hypothetical protein A2708_00060 [Candidatus Saccharibacteria bacterium RIFCSPHIGHO2_01_FULL_49_21]OGL36490.1 MAG: hypothetical protein A3E49_01920 [Candidatus Saccharibacteria bacterium RIFCSPHIGHO2_12_FULL_49_19]